MVHCGHAARHRFSVILMLTLALGACGGGGGSSDPGFIGGGSGGGGETPPPDVTIELTLTNSNGEPTTNVTTGVEKGVTKAVEAAIATVMASGYGDTPITSAARTAIGATRTAVAVFESTRPRPAVRAKIAVIIL